MSFFKSLVLYDYLYSPKSWLHKQPSNIKTIIFLFYLISLPYLSLQKILISLVIYILIYKSIYTPKSLTYGLFKIFSIFNLFILINIQYSEQILEGLKLGRQYILINISKQSFFQFTKFKSIDDKYFSTYYYIPNSLLRILSINFLYLVIIKILLLTTSHKKILDSFFYYVSKPKNNFVNKFIFEIQVSIQFLNTIFFQIKMLKIGYKTRLTKVRNKLSYRYNFLMMFFCIQQLIFNIYEQIYYLSNTIYYYEIHNKNINMIYNRLK